MNIGGFDLNLLVAFDAIHAEGNISLAARRLGKSQPALSAALGRLRVLLGDPLFLRQGNGMRPTPRAKELAGDVRRALSVLEASLDPAPPFSPPTSQRVFRVNLNDYNQAVILPGLMAWLGAHAPFVSLQLSDLAPSATELALVQGEVDLAVDCHPLKRAGLYRQRLFDDTFVCLFRRGHPQLRGRITKAQFLALPHATAQYGSEPSLAERILRRKGIRRRNVVTLPHCALGPPLAATTNLIVVAPRRHAFGSAAHLPLQISEPPVPMGGFSSCQFWTDHTHRDPANQWLRAAIKELAVAAEAGAERTSVKV